ncbi:response regulator [Phenylobacterium sp.]|uniref:response regulator n=1 Tax=Phenylobacterium sp. TaxID=1871053 RepID=UPI0035AF773B
MARSGSSAPKAPKARRVRGAAPISPEALGSLSHEFRTPLNGILGMARVLEGTPLSAEQRAYVAALRDSGEHLLSLVNDVLDFAKLGAGKVELRLAPVDVEALLRTVCELMSPRVREKGLEIAWSAPGDLAPILADEGRLRQILLNFAGNAAKFAEEGGVLIRAERTDGQRLRFTVEDTGPGVSKAARKTIFEAFAQADQGHETLQAGAGLGLAINRQLARAMNGEVGVGEARLLPAGGAAFWLEAPFEAAGEAQAEQPLKGVRVGIASPSCVVRAGARGQVEACGGQAAEAADLAGAVAATGDGDVVLVDQALAKGRRYLTPPANRRAIILLAPEERGRIARYRKAGFAGYLIKPLRRASLAARVLADPAEGVAPAQAHDDERVRAATAPGARVLLVEDNPINALLARTLLTREGCAVDHARAGEEALAAVKVGAYDLILMDMRMPGLSGVEASRRLRADGVTTPIVALTANAFEEDRHACLAAGMDDFLVKPLSPEALRSVLSRRLDRARFTAPAARAKVG